MFKDVLSLYIAVRTSLPNCQLAPACCSCCFYRDKVTCC